MSTTAAGNRGVSPMKAARRQEEEMDDAVQRVAERARAAGTARPKSEVKTRRVDPKKLQDERPRGAPDFRERGLRKRICHRPDCNMEFQPTSPSQKYHDKECRELHEQEKRSASRKRVPGSPPHGAPHAPRVSADPAPSGQAETRGNSNGQAGRYVDLLFKVAEDRDEEPAVRISALELLDDFVKNR